MKQFLRPKGKGQAGVTLIELMIAMVLGLLLILGLSNVYLAQRQSYRVNENLARMQDNARIAFELMARELREAGGNACGTPVVKDLISGPGGTHISEWNVGGVQGYGPNSTLPGVATGNATAQRVANTDALMIRTGSLGTQLIISSYDPSTAEFKLSAPPVSVDVGDVLMACDYRQAAILEVASKSDVNSSIVHTTTAGEVVNLEGNGFLSPMLVTRWYIGNNARGGRSLFRAQNGEPPQEVAEGVVAMELRYLTRTGTSPDSYRSASDIESLGTTAPWGNAATRLVIAVRVVLGLESLAAVGTDAANSSAVLKRQLVHLVSLRHREALQ